MMLLRQYEMPSQYLQYLRTPQDTAQKRDNQLRIGIFTRFWRNFGLESHKIVRYLVLNVFMTHYDTFETM